MKYINRTIMNDLKDYMKYFPVLLISAARQYFPENITPAIADTTSLESCVRKAIELNN